MRHVVLFEAFQNRTQSEQRFKRKLDSKIKEYLYRKAHLENYEELRDLAKLGFQIRDGKLQGFPESMNPQDQVRSWERSIRIETKEMEDRKRQVLKALKDPSKFEAEVKKYTEENNFPGPHQTDPELRKQIQDALHKGRGALKGDKFNF
jgi:hypothetical protein